MRVTTSDSDVTTLEMGGSDAPQGALFPIVNVALESVLRTDDLNGRLARLPDYETENRALEALTPRTGRISAEWGIHN